MRRMGMVLVCWLLPSMASAMVVIPDFGDLNCDGTSDVLDVQLAILSALNFPLNPILDTDANGTLDTCDDYVNAISGDCVVGQVIKWNGTVWACADDVAASAETGGGGSTGTVLYTRCPWVGGHGKDIQNCDPPACPDGWEDLGVVANRMVHSTGTGASSGIMDSSYTTAHGNQERGCFHTSGWTVLTTACSWVGYHGKDVATCDPPECPDDWEDLGVTGHRVGGAGTTGASSGIMDSSYTAAHGTQERTCVR